jgi:hypothetical protein
VADTCVSAWLLQLGPVVGRVTMHSALILCEVDARCRLKCVLVDVLLQERVVVEHDCAPNVPKPFLMENLRPGRRYLIFLEVIKGDETICF